MENKNEHVVVALFNSQTDADNAIEHLKAWDKARDNVKLGAVGTLYSENGEIKTKAGRKAGSGAKAGLVLGVVAGLLTGGIGLVGGALAGGALGGLTGSLFKKSVNLTEDDIASLSKDLQAGKVGVIVTCDEYEMTGVSSNLQYSGGEIKQFFVPAETAEEVAKGMEVDGRPTYLMVDEEFADPYTAVKFNRVPSI